MLIVVGVDLGLCIKDRADLGISSSLLKQIIMKNMTLNVPSEREEFLLLTFIHNGERNGNDISGRESWLVTIDGWLKYFPLAFVQFWKVFWKLTCRDLFSIDILLIKINGTNSIRRKKLSIGDLLKRLAVGSDKLLWWIHSTTQISVRNFFEYNSNYNCLRFRYL